MEFVYILLGFLGGVVFSTLLVASLFVSMANKSMNKKGRK